MAGNSRIRVGEAGETFRRDFRAQNKTPRAQFESWAPVDQPSPKCCSRTTLSLSSKPVNGSLVPLLRGAAPTKSCAQNKTPRAQFESWAPVDQPSPKCCSRTTLSLSPKTVNGSLVLWPAQRSYRNLARKTKRPRLNLSPGRLLISPPPSAAR
jgi:hypothetical protein